CQDFLNALETRVMSGGRRENAPFACCRRCRLVDRGRIITCCRSCRSDAAAGRRSAGGRQPERPRSGRSHRLPSGLERLALGAVLLLGAGPALRVRVLRGTAAVLSSVSPLPLLLNLPTFGTA